MKTRTETMVTIKQKSQYILQERKNPSVPIAGVITKPATRLFIIVVTWILMPEEEDGVLHLQGKELNLGSLYNRDLCTV